MESRTITVEGLRTRVLDENVDGATGDPILLVHGVGGWAENWRAVIRPLAASRRRVVALDLPGFGASARPGRVRYFSGEKAFYPRFVLGAMDVLGISRAHLGGQSMGGAIVAITAVTAPERVRSMMLVAPGGLGREVALYLRLCALPGMGLVARLPRSPSAARAALESCYFDVSRITPELYAEAERYGGPSFPEFVRARTAADATLEGGDGPARPKEPSAGRGLTLVRTAPEPRANEAPTRRPPRPDRPSRKEQGTCGSSHSYS